MDVRLSPEQEALRDSVAQVVRRLGPKTVLDLDDAHRASLLDDAVAQAGVRGLRAAEGVGAPLASAIEPALVAEVLSRGVADVPFLGPTLAVELRRIAGAPDASGTETVALTHDLGAPAIEALGGLPKGTVAFDAANANTALVLVADTSGYTLATVELAGPPGNSGALAGIDLTRPTLALGTAELTSVDSTHVITEEKLTRWKALGLALASAELVGVMDGAITLARDYAIGRSQYGAPVGSFQAVQHLLADALVLLEGSRSTSLHAAWAVDALSPATAHTSAAVAKAYAARCAQEVVETCIQIHGGNGNTWEYLPHVYLRRSIVARDLLGGVGASLGQIQSAYQIGS